MTQAAESLYKEADRQMSIARKMRRIGAKTCVVRECVRQARELGRLARWSILRAAELS